MDPEEYIGGWITRPLLVNDINRVWVEGEMRQHSLALTSLQCRVFEE